MPSSVNDYLRNLGSSGFLTIFNDVAPGKNPKINGNAINFDSLCCDTKQKGYVYLDSLNYLKCSKQHPNSTLYDLIQSKYNLSSFSEIISKMYSIAGRHIEFRRDNENSVSRYQVYNAMNKLFLDAIKEPDSKAMEYMVSRGYTRDEVITMGVGEFLPIKEVKEFVYRNFPNIRNMDRDKSTWIQIFNWPENGLGGDNLISVPFKDYTGRVTGFNVRSIQPGEFFEKPENKNAKKYIQTKDSHRGDNFFNIENNVSKERLVVVESYIDALYSSCKGINGVVSVGGAAMTGRQIENAIQLNGTRDIILALDNPEIDKAGKRATISSLCRIDQRGGTPYVMVDYGGCKDPDEIIRKYGPDAFEECINRAIPGFKWLTAHLVDEIFNSNIPEQFKSRKLFYKIADMYKTIQSDIAKGHVIDTLSEALRIPKENVFNEVKSVLVTDSKKLAVTFSIDYSSYMQLKNEAYKNKCSIDSMIDKLVTQNNSNSKKQVAGNPNEVSSVTPKNTQNTQKNQSEDKAEFNSFKKHSPGEMFMQTVSSSSLLSSIKKKWKENDFSDAEIIEDSPSIRNDGPNKISQAINRMKSRLEKVLPIKEYKEDFPDAEIIRDEPTKILQKQKVENDFSARNMFQSSITDNKEKCIYFDDIEDAVAYRGEKKCVYGPEGIENTNHRIRFYKTDIKNLGEMQIFKGSALFEGSDVNNLGKLKEISGNAIFNNSEVNSLGKIEKIGGNVDFRDSLITNLGNLKEIGGDAVLWDSNVESLGNKIEKIGGNAYFDTFNLTDLGNLKEIGGDLNLGKYANYGSVLANLGALEKIGGNVKFSETNVHDLGNLTKIGGDADFRNSKIDSLGELKEIKGDLLLDGSKIKTLGRLEKVGGIIKCDGCSEELLKEIKYFKIRQLGCKKTTQTTITDNAHIPETEKVHINKNNVHEVREKGFTNCL